MEGARVAYRRASLLCRCSAAAMSLLFSRGFLTIHNVSQVHNWSTDFLAARTAKIPRAASPTMSSRRFADGLRSRIRV